jgi:hypothetical protein
MNVAWKEEWNFQSDAHDFLFFESRFKDSFLSSTMIGLLYPERKEDYSTIRVSLVD